MCDLERKKVFVVLERGEKLYWDEKRQQRINLEKNSLMFSILLHPLPVAGTGTSQTSL
jgi:hypothetical protein